MGFSHLLVSNLNSVKYCAFSVGEKVQFRIICGTPHISSTICPHNSSLSLFLSPVSALRTERGSAFYHGNSPFSLLITLLPTLNQTMTCCSKTSFTGPQATDNHSSSHAHNTILTLRLLMSFFYRS